MAPRQGTKSPRVMSKPGRRVLDGFFKRLHAYERDVKGGRDVVGVLASIYKCLTMCEQGVLSVDQGRKLATMYSELLFDGIEGKTRTRPSERSAVWRSRIGSGSTRANIRSVTAWLRPRS